MGSKAKEVSKSIKYVICLLLLWFVVQTIIVSYDGLHDELGASDVGVVLGSKVELDGTPSPNLKWRLDKTLALYEKGNFPFIIVSGGMGKEGYSEALVMKEYLMEHGVPAEKIILDEEGNDTYRTALNTKKIMHQNGYQSVTVISQFYHIARTKLAFQKAGVEKVYSAHATRYSLRDLYSLVREFPAYYKYLLI